MIPKVGVMILITNKLFAVALLYPESSKGHTFLRLAYGPFRTLSLFTSPYMLCFHPNQGTYNYHHWQQVG